MRVCKARESWCPPQMLPSASLLQNVLHGNLCHRLLYKNPALRLEAVMFLLQGFAAAESRAEVRVLGS